MAALEAGITPLVRVPANPALNEATLVCVMMEAVDALEHVEEIAAVERFVQMGARYVSASTIRHSRAGAYALT